MRTLLQRIAVLALPLAVLMVSACSDHHWSHHDRNAWQNEAYNLRSSGYRYDERGTYNDGSWYDGGGRHDGGDRWSWLRW